MLLFYAIVAAAFVLRLLICRLAREATEKRWRREIVKGSFKNPLSLTGIEAAGLFAAVANVRCRKIAIAMGIERFKQSTQTLILSPFTAYGNSLVALTIVAHEICHAAQYEEGDILMRLRGATKGPSEECYMLAILAFTIGLVFVATLWALATPTLPVWVAMSLAVPLLVSVSLHLVVEIDASRRALKLLSRIGLAKNGVPYRQAEQILLAAALTHAVPVLEAVTALAFFALPLLIL